MIATYKIELSQLPSGGKPYPQDLEIKVRPFTLGELKEFSVFAESNNVGEIFEKLKDGIIVRKFDKNDFTMYDFIFLSLVRVLYSFKEQKLTINLTCNKCNTKNIFTINIGDIEFDEIKAPELPVNVEIEGEVYSFNPLTIGDFLFLEKNNLVDDFIAMYSVMAIDNAADFQKVYEKFNNLTLENAQLLNTAIEYVNHGIKPMQFKCKKCGTIIPFEMTNIKELMVLPFRSSGEKTIDTNAITFGKRITSELEGNGENGNG